MKKPFKSLTLTAGFLAANLSPAAVFTGETIIDPDWRWNDWLGYYNTTSEPWIWSLRYDDWLWVNPADETKVFSNKLGITFDYFAEDALPYLYDASGTNFEPIIYNPVSPSLSPETVKAGYIYSFSFGNMPTGQTLDHSDSYYTTSNQYYPLVNEGSLWASWIRFYDFVEEDALVSGTHMQVKAPVVSAAGTSTARWGISLKVEITDGPRASYHYDPAEEQYVGTISCEYNGYQIEDNLDQYDVLWQAREIGQTTIYDWPQGASEVIRSWGDTYANFEQSDSGFFSIYEYRVKLTNYAGTIYSDWVRF